MLRQEDSEKCFIEDKKRAAIQRSSQFIKQVCWRLADQ